MEDTKDKICHQVMATRRLITSSGPSLKKLQMETQQRLTSSQNTVFSNAPLKREQRQRWSLLRSDGTETMQAGKQAQASRKVHHRSSSGSQVCLTQAADLGVSLSHEEAWGRAGGISVDSQEHLFL